MTNFNFFNFFQFLEKKLDLSTISADVPTAKLASIPKVANIAVERNESLDYLLETLLSSLKFFASNEGFAQNDNSVRDKMTVLFDLSKKLKLMKSYETGNDELWGQVCSHV